MQAPTELLDTPDGQPIPLREWSVENPRAVVHISHGMAEHCGRYEPLARELNKAGIAVFAHDHRGHGLNPGRRLGHYADEDGWRKVTEDLNRVYEHVKRRHPDLPVFLLAHSMGSFIAMGFLQNHQTAYRGIILSGSDYTPPLKFVAALPIAKAEKLILGAASRAPVMSFLSFGSFNKGIKPPQTRYDWLSRDPDEVAKYLKDPYCGFDCTNQLWVDLLGGLSTIYQSANMRKLPHCPFYLFAGSQDPVGRYGTGVKALQKQLSKAGIPEVTMRLYPDGRHEMVNEMNRDEVVQDLINWLDAHI